MIFGYLDPVTGSALVQVALGALAAIGLGWQYIRKFGRDISARFRGEATEPAVTEAEYADTEPGLS